MQDDIARSEIVQANNERTLEQNAKLAKELERRRTDHDRKEREIQRICEESEELKELERRLKAALLADTLSSAARVVSRSVSTRADDSQVRYGLVRGVGWGSPRPLHSHLRVKGSDETVDISQRYVRRYRRYEKIPFR